MMFDRKLFIFMLAFFIFCVSSCNGNDNDKDILYNKNFEYVTFSSGGVLGVAYVGAFQALEDYNIKKINDIKGFSGASVGSIMATMCALRYSPDEMKKLIFDLNFYDLIKKGMDSIETEDIFGNKGASVSGIVELLFNKGGSFGLDDGSFLENWVEDLIKNKVGKSNATFADLKSNSEFGELYVVASDISNNKLQIFSAEHTPDFVVSRAVRASVSIPILFEVVISGDQVLVDGGMYDEYPINLFRDKPFKDVLGFVFTPHPILKNGQVKVEDVGDRFSWSKYIFSVVTSTFTAQFSSYLESDEPKRTIMMDNKGIYSFDFSITNEQKEILFEEGYRAVKDAFKKNNKR